MNSSYLHELTKHIARDLNVTKVIPQVLKVFQLQTARDGVTQSLGQAFLCMT